MSEEHSPLPWTMESPGCISDATRDCVLGDACMTHADTQFIVRCVNSFGYLLDYPLSHTLEVLDMNYVVRAVAYHEELVRTLRNICGSHRGVGRLALIDEARELLARMKGAA